MFSTINFCFQVVGLARRKEKLDSLATTLTNRRGHFYPLVVDISNEEEVISAFDWTSQNLGPIHILVNNAGFLQSTTLCNGDTEIWKQIFNTNVMGLCVATREAVRDMRKYRVDGHIVHINSISGYYKNFFTPGCNVYPASKHAVSALTETLRMELRSANNKIKVTVSEQSSRITLECFSKAYANLRQKRFLMNVSKAVRYLNKLDYNLQTRAILIFDGT